MAKNKDQGTNEDYVEVLCTLTGRNGTIMGTEICHVHVALGEEMAEEEVEMLMAGHEDTMVVSIIKSLVG